MTATVVDPVDPNDRLRSEDRAAAIGATADVPLIRAQNLSVELGGRRIVDAVSVDLRPGEMTALVGPNGAGKSTLLALLTGERTLTSGTVHYGNTTLSSLKQRHRAQIRSVLPQHTNTLFSFTAREVVMMGRFPWDSSTLDDQRIANDSLRQAGAAHLAERSFPTLSGGEQALVNLARVLTQRTPIVFLDEPTAALDLGHQELVMRIADTLARSGHTVVVVVHDLNLAARFAHRVLVLDQGRLVADGSPRDALRPDLLSRLYRHPVAVIDHPFLRGRPLILPAPC